MESSLLKNSKENTKKHSEDIAGHNNLDSGSNEIYYFEGRFNSFYRKTHVQSSWRNRPWISKV